MSYPGSYVKEESVIATLLVKFAPYRNYLEDAVVRQLMNGMLHVLIERPENPLVYLGDYLISKDPDFKPPPPEEKQEAACEHCAHSPPPPPPPPPPPAEEAPPA